MLFLSTDDGQQSTVGATFAAARTGGGFGVLKRYYFTPLIKINLIDSTDLIPSDCSGFPRLAKTRPCHSDEGGIGPSRASKSGLAGK
jgi:hypothetical protein